jgi:hypothetical protein
MRRNLRNNETLNMHQLKYQTEKFLQALEQVQDTTSIGGTALRRMPRESKKQMAMQMIEARFKKKYPLG